MAVAPYALWVKLCQSAAAPAATPTASPLLEEVTGAACRATFGGMLLEVAYRHRTREATTLASALRIGLRHARTLFSLGLIFGAVFAPLAWLIASLRQRVHGTNPALLAVGALAATLVAVVFFVVTSAAEAAAVVESRGPFAALARSRALTRNCGWRIVACLGVLGILVQLVTRLVRWVGAAVVVDDPLHLDLVTAVLTEPLIASFHAILYHALRAAKEGADTTVLERVFD